MLELRQSQNAERLSRSRTVVLHEAEARLRRASTKFDTFIERLNGDKRLPAASVGASAVTQLLDRLSWAGRVRLGERPDAILLQLRVQLLMVSGTSYANEASSLK